MIVSSFELSTINISTSVHNELSLQTALKLGIKNKLFCYHPSVSWLGVCYTLLFVSA